MDPVTIEITQPVAEIVTDDIQPKISEIVEIIEVVKDLVQHDDILDSATTSHLISLENSVAMLTETVRHLVIQIEEMSIKSTVDEISKIEETSTLEDLPILDVEFPVEEIIKEVQPPTVRVAKRRGFI